MSTRTVLIETDPAGDFEWQEPLFGAIIAIRTEIGDLDAPTIVISDPEAGNTVRTMTSLATDDFWQPGNPIAVFGTLRVTVSGAGDTRHGNVRFLLET